MSKTVLKKYNQLAVEALTVIDELEKRCKVLHEETVKEFANEVIFCRIYACFYKAKNDKILAFYFYRMDTAVFDCDGDVVDVVPFEYGVL